MNGFPDHDDVDPFNAGDDLPDLSSEAHDSSHADRPAAGHLPVLPTQVVDLLAPQPNQTLIDCTVGRGGHAALLIPRMPGGTYLALDTDAGNAAFSRSRLEPLAAEHGVTLHVLHRNFASLQNARMETALGRADMLLADLGFASNQMDDPNRGFTFQADGPLDMRLDQGGGSGPAGTTAADLVNTLPEKELADLIYQYGEERLSRRIARKIVERRSVEPIQTTGALAELVRRAYPPPGRPAPSRTQGRRGKGTARGKGNFRGGHRIHPATRTFMALRIAVNGELDVLDGLLRGLPQVMAKDGRVAIISFHSLEDRPVKQAFLKLQQDGLAERLTRKPITAEEDEISTNPRSRSAKLRGVKMNPIPTAQSSKNENR